MAAQRLALTALLLTLSALAPPTSAQRRTPEAICAANPTKRWRYSLNATAFVACLLGDVWEVRRCPQRPTGFTFNEATQTCVLKNKPYVPQGPYQGPPRPPATPSTYLLAWAGPDNPSRNCRDAVAVLDATPESRTFGNVVHVAFTPTWGNEPHHVGLANNSILAVGGIQAYLKGDPDINYFDASDPPRLRWTGAVDPPKSAVTDSFIAQPDGGFWVSQMGDATGGAPGRIVRLAGNRTVLRELPERPPAGFNPHGFAIDATRNRIVTADYLDLKSTLTGPGVPTRFRGTGPTKYRRTLRVWELPDFRPVGQLSIPQEDSLGFMTVQFVGSSGVAVSGNGRGVLFAVNATDASGGKPAHFISPLSSSCVMIPLAFSSGTRFFVTSLGLSLVQLVDTSDPFRWRTLQEIYLPPNTYPHAATATRNGTLVAVSTYYLNQFYRGTPLGTLRQRGSREVYFFSVAADGNSFEFNRRRPVVDFKRDVSNFLRRGRPNIASCGLWRPHGIVFRAPPPPAPPTPAGR